jgi:signal transduction histidine kinase
MNTEDEAIPQARASFVSTVRPTAAQRNTAAAVAVLSVAVFALAAPFAQTPLRPVPAFVPLYQSALIVFDLITSVLLFGQYRMLRSRALLLLAAGYVFSAMMATAHALSFPDLFAPGAFLGTGTQTTAWLYFLWHGGFALFILAYGVSDIGRRLRGEHDSSAVAMTLAFTGFAASVPIVMASSPHSLLPPIMAGNTDGSGKIVVAMVTWLIGFVALAVLWRRRPRTVLDLWLMVVLCVWIADTALASTLNHARFDLGWYVGRVYGLFANGFVLGVLLLESGSLYARLARSNRLLGEALAETRRLNGDLQAFAGSLAHDLQQPLITITSFAQVIQHGGKLGEREQAHLARIMAAAEAAREMIRALLEFARLGERRLEMGRVDLNEAVARARAMVNGNVTSREIEWKIQPLPVVQGDAALLSLAMTNLLSNAVKYSRTRDKPVIAVECEAQAPGTHTIRVRDNGVGFDMSQASRLFAPFERLHGQHEFEGTGMGLANVRRIVERHGGTISASSEPGRGAEFTIVLGDQTHTVPPLHATSTYLPN